MSQAIAYLVETIPLGMESLNRSTEVSGTGVVLKRLVDSSSSHIDLTAMYWSLLPDDKDEDTEGLSQERLTELGAERGRLLYEALAEAARRGVTLRILQSPGFRAGPHESDSLAQAYPKSVQVRQLDMHAWYGAGIMHQKMWVFDRRHIYIGSANMDWRSFSQVRELGLVVENHPRIAADAAKQFETLWRLCEMEAVTTRVFDPDARITRPVPAWSSLAPAESRVASPWANSALRTGWNAGNPLRTRLNGQVGEAFMTSSPSEFCAVDRTSDLEGILHTIHTAQKSICVSVMDFTPAGMLGDEYDEVSGNWTFEGGAAIPVWWPAIANALLQAAVTRGVHVRLLVSHWAYTASTTGPHLEALQATADACSADPTSPYGRLEIRRFVIPGWDKVTGIDREYPGHSRVNHAKYIVTDGRVNVGTSNLAWSYFATSVGTSFNSTHPALIEELQKIFDWDWNSPYARLPGEID